MPEQMNNNLARIIAVGSGNRGGKVVEFDVKEGDIAEITGNTTDSIKSSTQPKKDFPRNLKLAIVIFERMSS